MQLRESDISVIVKENHAPIPSCYVSETRAPGPRLQS